MFDPTTVGWFRLMRKYLLYLSIQACLLKVGLDSLNSAVKTHLSHLDMYSVSGWAGHHRKVYWGCEGTTFYSIVLEAYPIVLFVLFIDLPDSRSTQKVLVGTLFLSLPLSLSFLSMSQNVPCSVVLYSYKKSFSGFSRKASFFFFLMDSKYEWVPCFTLCRLTD